MESPDGWKALRELTDRMVAIADDVTVVLVANSKSASAHGAGDRSSEYLSDSEASQLLSGLREAGFRTRYVEGERSLMEAMLRNPRLDTTSSKMIVYNIAQSGSDPGRKSLVPSFCALNGIPTCNSGAYAVSLARNKLHVHSVLRKFGIPTPDTWAYRAGHGWLMGARPPEIGMLIAKACQESSSVGLDARSVAELSPAFERLLDERSAELGQPMVVQPLIRGREIEAPMAEIAGKWIALGPAVITLGGDDHLDSRILDFDTIAHDGYGFAEPKPEMDSAVMALRQAAEATCEVLGLRGFCRVDFRVTDDGSPYVTDVATSPHLVWHGAFSHVFRTAGWEHRDMMAAMVAVNAARIGWI